MIDSVHATVSRRVIDDGNGMVLLNAHITAVGRAPESALEAIADGPHPHPMPSSIGRTCLVERDVTLRIEGWQAVPSMRWAPSSRAFGPHPSNVDALMALGKTQGTLIDVGIERMRQGKAREWLEFLVRAPCGRTPRGPTKSSQGCGRRPFTSHPRTKH